MSLTPREQRIFAEIERSLRADDPHLNEVFTNPTGRWALRPLPPPPVWIWTRLFVPQSLWAALATTFVLQVVLAISCDRVARAGNLWPVLLVLLALPLALAPIVAYTRAHP